MSRGREAVKKVDNSVRKHYDFDARRGGGPSYPPLRFSPSTKRNEDYSRVIL